MGVETPLVTVLVNPRSKERGNYPDHPARPTASVGLVDRENIENKKHRALAPLYWPISEKPFSIPTISSHTLKTSWILKRFKKKTSSLSL
jgi:hypothetical protein